MGNSRFHRPGDPRPPSGNTDRRADRDAVITHVKLTIESTIGTVEERAHVRQVLADFRNEFSRPNLRALDRYTAKILKTRPAGKRDIEFVGDEFRWL